MALTFGAGITIGGGITLQIESAGDGGSPSANSFTVAEYPYNSDTYYGASTVSGFDFGTLTSDYINGIWRYTAAASNNVDGYTFIQLKAGTYTGFSASGTYPAIDSDKVSYTRYFKINGNQYEFFYDGYQYVNRTDPANLGSSVGSTFTIEYDPNTQPSNNNNTMVVENYTYLGSIYGANIFTDQGDAVYGKLISDYFLTIRYASGYPTEIRLKNGSYTGFSVSAGAIDSDTNGSSRIFSINGIDYSCTFSGGFYSATGDVFNLTSASGSISVVYDPNAQGGGAGSYSPQYTSDPGPNPWPITADYGYVTYHDMFGLTIKGMKSSSDLYTFLGSAGSGDSLKVTFSGTDYTFTLGDYNPGTIFSESDGPNTYYTVSITGTTISPSLSAGEGVTLYGTLISELTSASSGTTYTAATDYADTPPNAGIMFFDIAGGTVIIDETYWSNAAGSTALLALTSGDTFTANVTSTDTTITLTSNWSGTPPYQATFTASPSITFSGPPIVPSSVTIGGAGGSGYAPQYTSDPGPSPWPTTADYGYVTYHDMFGLTVKGMKSSSDIYTFLSSAGTGDSFKVTFSGTDYTFTLGDYNPGTIFPESDGPNTYYTVSIYSTPSPTLNAGEGTTLYGTMISNLTQV